MSVIYNLKNKKIISFGQGWYFKVLLPTLNYLKLIFVAERLLLMEETPIGPLIKYKLIELMRTLESALGFPLALSLCHINK